MMRMKEIGDKVHWLWLTVHRLLDQVSSNVSDQAFVDVTSTYHVDNAGTTDAAPAITAALASLTANGRTAWFPDGLYDIDTVPTIPAGSMLRVSPGATFTGTQAAVMTALAAPEALQQNGAASTTAATPIQAIQSANNGNGAFGGFEQFLFSTPFAGTWDNLMCFGWNASRRNATDAVSRWNWEQNYFVGGQNLFETYLEYWPWGQGSFYRPLYTNCNRSTAEGVTIIAHGLGNGANSAVAIQNGEGTISYALFGAATSEAGGVTIGVAALPFTLAGQMFTATTGNATWTSSGFIDFVAVNIYLDGTTTHFRNDGASSTYGQIGAAGLQIQVPLLGQSVPLQTGSASVGLSHGGATVLTAPQYQNPTILLTDTGLTSTATVTLPTTTGPSEWTVNTLGVTFGGHSVVLSMGTGAKQVTVNAGSVQRIYSDGTGNLYALTYT